MLPALMALLGSGAGAGAAAGAAAPAAAGAAGGMGGLAKMAPSLMGMLGGGQGGGGGGSPFQMGMSLGSMLNQAPKQVAPDLSQPSIQNAAANLNKGVGTGVYHPQVQQMARGMNPPNQNALFANPMLTKMWGTN